MRTWILGRFDRDTDLAVAANKLRGLGHGTMEGFMPYPSHTVLDAVKPKASPIPYMVFVGGLTGFCFGFALQYYCGVIDYPINIGGRDIFSPTTYVPILFECVILFSVLTAVFSVFILSGLPMPYHPFFTAETFQLASSDAFCLAVEAKPGTDAAEVIQREMSAAGAHSVNTVDEVEA